MKSQQHTFSIPFSSLSLALYVGHFSLEVCPSLLDLPQSVLDEGDALHAGHVGEISCNGSTTNQSSLLYYHTPHTTHHTQMSHRQQGQNNNLRVVQSLGCVVPGF